MEYPPDFPKHLQPAIDKAIARAEVEFLTAKGRVSWDYNRDAARDITERYIKRCFFAFARQARKAGCEGTWRGEKIRKEVDEYLRKLLIKTYYEKKPGQLGTSNHFEYEMTTWIKESTEWIQHQRGMERVAKIQASRSYSARPGWTQPTAHPLRKEEKSESILEARKAVVLPILDKKGWSIEDWANESDVAYHTANDYLSGKTNPHRYNRIKLAKALGIGSNSLPH